MSDPTDGQPAYGDFPLRRFLGMELTGEERGIGHAHVDVGPDHLNPNGVVHGAVLFALVDTAMGKATMSVVDEPGRYCASIEVSLRFIRPAVTGRLTATATVVKRGRNVVHLDGRVADADDRLVATAAGTFALLGDPS
jgi:uncharacterized protein (TIGR00369 family)